MIHATDLISTDVEVLHPSDACGDALSRMMDSGVSHWPVSDQGLFVGMVSAHDLRDQKPGKPVRDNLMSVPVYRLESHSHLFQILSVFSQANYSVLAVTDGENYLGAISLPHLLELSGQLLTLSQEGAIVTLEMKPNNYVLSEISRFAENDGLKIIGVLIHKQPESDNIQVHLKLNDWEVSRFIGTLTRFNYQIAGVFTTASVLDDLRTRYDALMKYLDL